MKRIIKIVLILLISLICTSCGKPDAKSVESVSEYFLKSIKKGDEGVLEYIYFGNNDGARFMNNLFGNLSESQTLSKYSNAISEKMREFDFKVNKVDEYDDSAVANVTITTENWSVIVNNIAIDFLPKALVMIIDGKDTKAVDKELMKFIDEQKKNNEDISRDIDVALIKVDGKWKIDASALGDSLSNVLLGMN